MIFLALVGFWIGRWCRLQDEDLTAAADLRQTEVDILSGVADDLRPLTIPFLRSRVYRSILHVGEVLTRGSNYTAYLAWYESDGAKVYGLLSVPTGEMPQSGWPAVILLHGYVNPSSYQTNGSSYRGWWQALAATGEWVVFKPDFRGHGSSEGLATGPYLSADYVVDALNARVALINYDKVDPMRIGLWGHSMSGNIALRALAARPDIPAVALWAGAVYTYEDFWRYGITDPSYRPDQDRAPSQQMKIASEAGQLFSRNGDIDLTTPFWRAMIPTNFLTDSSKTGAIALFHAADDEVVNVGYSEDLDTWLDETAISHELHVYPSGGHNLTGSSFGAAMAAMREFFRVNMPESSTRANVTE